jgi:hypothetical protein
MQRLLVFTLLAIVLLSACASPANDQGTVNETQSSVVTVYRSPT